MTKIGRVAHVVRPDRAVLDFDECHRRGGPGSQFANRLVRRLDAVENGRPQLDGFAVLVRRRGLLQRFLDGFRGEPAGPLAPACPPRPSATASTPLVRPIGHSAATSSLAVSFCGDRVVNTATLPPRNSNEATSVIWASNSIAPSDRRRRARRWLTPTALGVENSASKGNTAPVLIVPFTFRGESANPPAVGIGRNWEIVEGACGRNQTDQPRRLKNTACFRAEMQKPIA